MTTFILIASFLIVLICLMCLAFLVRFVFKKWISHYPVYKENLNWQIIYAILIALICMVGSLLAPYIFTRSAITKSFDFHDTGEIGDTLGGIMNPFIALSGVIVTGLAFYMQYRANQLQRILFDEQVKREKDNFEQQLKQAQEHFEKQFKEQEQQTKIQRFQDQFYEMLRLHKENVNEIELPAKRIAVKLPNDITYESYTLGKREAFVEFNKEFEAILKAIKKSDFEKVNKESFEAAYEFFFWGLKDIYRTEEQRSMQELFEDDKSLENILWGLKNNQFLKSEFASLPDLKINAFEGHSGLLGHYFRHLYHTVKFVVKQPKELISYNEKLNYLKILRAQLSNHEQILLFYNWLSGYGAAWENKKHQYFTEYCMIHNLWYNSMISEDYIQGKVVMLREKPVEFRKGPMFEIDDQKT